MIVKPSTPIRAFYRKSTILSMRHFVLSLGDHLSAQYIGPAIRKLGFAIDRVGVKLTNGYVEKCNFYADNRSVRLVPSKTAVPDLSKADFVAPNASVVG